MSERPPTGSDAIAGIQGLIQSAQQALSGGRLDETERLCKQALEIDRRVGPAHYLLGLVAARRNQRYRAIEEFRAVLATDPKAYEALDWLASLLRDEGEWNEALRIASQMMKLQPKNPAGARSMGMTLMAQGKAGEAEPFFRQTVGLAPQVSVYHYHLGRSLEQLARAEEATSEFRSAISLAPNVAAPYEALSDVLWKSGRRTESIETLQKAVEISPSRDTLIRLGNELNEEGRHIEAERWLRKAVALQPDFAPSHVILGIALETLGRFEEARECFSKAMELDPTKVGPYFCLLRSRRVTDSDAEMVAKMETMALEPGRTEEDLRKLSYALGKAYNDLGSYEKAFRHYTEANRYAFKVRFGGAPFDVPQHRAWLDLVIRRFDKAFFQRMREFGSENERPVFIVGMIRSGTTLTEQILSSHPKISAGGELPFWTNAENVELSHRLVAGIADVRNCQSTIQTYLQLLSRIDPASERVTDKMPLNYLSLGLIHALFPKARIIHCKRDPIDTCLSIFITPFEKSPEFCYQPEAIVGAYKEYRRLMDHWRSVLPKEIFMEVEYEEMVSDHDGVVRRLIDFCGLEWDDACLSHEENLRPVRTPSTWQARQPIYSSSVKRWRRYEPWLGPFLELADGQ